MSEWLSGLRNAASSGAGRWVLLSVGVLLLAAAGAAFLRGCRVSHLKDEIVAHGYDAVYYCPACKAGGHLRLQDTDTFPIVCPRCSQRQALAGFECFRCKTILPRRPALFACPTCGQVHDHRRPQDAPENDLGR